MSIILVVGYGNTLRGDDGVGYQVAATVADWHIPQVRSLAVHQLLPELAAALVEVDTVVFVDAAIALNLSTPDIAMTPLVASGDDPLSTHSITPQFLLGLAQRLYGLTPSAYLLTIPAIDFTLGTTLSPIARQGQKLALDYLSTWLHAPTAELCMKSVC